MRCKDHRDGIGIFSPHFIEEYSVQHDHQKEEKTAQVDQPVGFIGSILQVNKYWYRKQNGRY
jgi:hypothetical protein